MTNGAPQVILSPVGSSPASSIRVETRAKPVDALPTPTATTHANDSISFVNLGATAPAEGGATSRGGTGTARELGGSLLRASAESLPLAKSRDYMYEVARMHTTNQALEAENRVLRDHAKKLVKKMSGVATELEHTTARNRLREESLTQEAAARVSSLEDQLDRHKKALAELAKASEQMSHDNALLGGEVARLRDEKVERDRTLAELQERLAGLQELYLRGVESAIPSTVTVKEATEQKFWRDIVKTDLLATTQPPEDFPLPVGAPLAQDAVVMLHENNGLRRQLDKLTQRNHVVEGELEDCKRQLGALQTQVTNERKAARELAGKLQSQLLGAVRRLWFSNEENKKAQGSLKEKDRYVRKLEDQLLAQHRTIQGLKRRVQERAQEDAAARTDALMGHSKPGSRGGSQAGARPPVAPSQPLNETASGPQGTYEPPSASSPSLQRTEAVIQRAQEASERLAGSLMRILHPELGGSRDPDRPLTETLMERLEGLATTSGEVVEAMAQVKAALELSQLPASVSTASQDAPEDYESSLFTYALERQELSNLRQRQQQASVQETRRPAAVTTGRGEDASAAVASESLGSMSLTAASSQPSGRRAHHQPHHVRERVHQIPTPSGLSTTTAPERDVSVADLVLGTEGQEVDQRDDQGPREDEGGSGLIEGSGISFPIEAGGLPSSDRQGVLSSPGFLPTPAPARGIRREEPEEATPSASFPRVLSEYLVMETPSALAGPSGGASAGSRRPGPLVTGGDPSVGAAQLSPIGDPESPGSSASTGLVAMREGLQGALPAGEEERERESPAAEIQRIAEERLENLEDLQLRLASIMNRLTQEDASLTASVSVSSQSGEGALPSPVPAITQEGSVEQFVSMSLAEIEGLARELQVQRDTTNTLLGGEGQPDPAKRGAARPSFGAKP